MLVKKAVCLHEEDHGTLWKHVEYRTEHSEVRRSRRLVLSFIATIGALSCCPVIHSNSLLLCEHHPVL